MGASHQSFFAYNLVGILSPYPAKVRRFRPKIADKRLVYADICLPSGQIINDGGNALRDGKQKYEDYKVRAVVFIPLVPLPVCPYPQPRYRISRRAKHSIQESSKARWCGNES